jgi:hypothetical protein
LRSSGVRRSFLSVQKKRLPPLFTSLPFLYTPGGATNNEPFLATFGNYLPFLANFGFCCGFVGVCGTLLLKVALF